MSQSKPRAQEGFSETPDLPITRRDIHYLDKVPKLGSQLQIISAIKPIHPRCTPVSLPFPETNTCTCALWRTRLETLFGEGQSLGLSPTKHWFTFCLWLAVNQIHTLEQKVKKTREENAWWSFRPCDWLTLVGFASSTWLVLKPFCCEVLVQALCKTEKNGPVLQQFESLSCCYTT